jgi:hypothetical protein
MQKNTIIYYHLHKVYVTYKLCLENAIYSLKRQAKYTSGVLKEST